MYSTDHFYAYFSYLRKVWLRNTNVFKNFYNSLSYTDTGVLKTHIIYLTAITNTLDGSITAECNKLFFFMKVKFTIFEDNFLVKSKIFNSN